MAPGCECCRRNRWSSSPHRKPNSGEGYASWTPATALWPTGRTFPYLASCRRAVSGIPNQDLMEQLEKSAKEWRKSNYQLTEPIKIVLSDELGRLLHKALSLIWMACEFRVVVASLVPPANRQQHFQVSVGLFVVCQTFVPAFAAVVFQILPRICN